MCTSQCSAATLNNAHAVHCHMCRAQSSMDIRPCGSIEPVASDSVGAQVLFYESEESVSLKTCAGNQHDSTVCPFESSSTNSSSDSTTETHDQTLEATEFLKPKDEFHKRELLQKGSNQPTSCNFPKKRYSNGNLSFNPSWYELKEARDWLEYSYIYNVQTNRIILFAMLFI